MKSKLFFVLGAAVSALLLLGISAKGKEIYEPKHSTAEVEFINGFYVFTDSRPVSDYQYLGSVSVSFATNAQYSPIRDKLLKKARKEYPEANGIILHLNSGANDKADAIRFK